MDGDAVDPGLQAGLAVEVPHPPEDLEEDLLGDVGRIAGIVQHAVYQAVDGLVVLRDEPGVGVLGAGFQLGYHRGLFRPGCNGAGQVAQSSCSRHGSHAVYTSRLAGYGYGNNSPSTALQLLAFHTYRRRRGRGSSHPPGA